MTRNGLTNAGVAEELREVEHVPTEVVAHNLIVFLCPRSDKSPGIRSILSLPRIQSFHRTKTYCKCWTISCTNREWIYARNRWKILATSICFKTSVFWCHICALWISSICKKRMRSNNLIIHGGLNYKLLCHQFNLINFMISGSNMGLWDLKFFFSFSL